MREPLAWRMWVDERQKRDNMEACSIYTTVGRFGQWAVVVPINTLPFQLRHCHHQGPSTGPRGERTSWSRDELGLWRCRGGQGGRWKQRSQSWRVRVALKLLRLISGNSQLHRQ